LKEKSLYNFYKKLKIKKKPKTILVGFFRWFFWVGLFGWVLYCQPCMEVFHNMWFAPISERKQGRGAEHHLLVTKVCAIDTVPEVFLGRLY
jgi:hypothetical protein